MIKKNILLGITIPIAIVGLIFSIALTVFSLTRNWHSPLQYCLWEIQSHENYESFSTFYYNELEPKSEIRKEVDKNHELYAYYITVFTEDRKGEWYCFIECLVPFYVLGLGTPRGYDINHVIAIDCDLAIETLI